ncbi:MAG: 50S ribosomal protein L21 [Pseudomonadales bacterium]
MTFAVIKSGGKQHRVQEGDILKLEKLDAEPGSEVVFDEVLMVANGDEIAVGSPYVAGGQVKAEVLAHDRADKVTIIKFRRRQDYRKKQGHRQWFTAVRITGISG